MQSPRIGFDDDSFMPFGKYKGMKLIDVPDSYLGWLYENKRSGVITDYIEENLDAIHHNIRKSRTKQ